MTVEDDRRDLEELVGRQASTMEVWQSAELCVLEAMLRERLALLGVKADQDMGVALMAAAQLLAERAPEWGGDARGTLAELAVLGLRLIDSGDEAGGTGEPRAPQR